ncbi:hypothetical protein [Marichromatium bheemlicum]|uniref:HipA-like C-terminal domain-containing protein n=1 Tax=Marichromatium bheemlicum TaxID=365339 RepID=A0ABX1I881_9GAMM|nr:hypothetical protein [Marichromatium bheemlicum]NKN33770.1 hypothetical protein [Marichromatium bheemlicum]
MQGRLWPLEIVRLDPVDLGENDLRAIGVGIDGLTYAIKRSSDAALLPATELICTRLALACDLPVLGGEIAQLPDATMAFASPWEGGTLASQEARVLLMTKGGVSSQVLSAILAFDLFVGNQNRHLGNFLVRRDPNHSVAAVVATDFSRALLMAGWPVPMLSPTCNTLVVAHALMRLHGFDRDAALRVTGRLYSLPNDTLERCCRDLPPHWLPHGIAVKLDDWWRNQRIARLEQVATVIDHAF